MKLFHLLFLVMVITVYAVDPSVEQNSNLKINVVKAEEQIVIDGKLDEKIWQRPGMTNLIQQDPDQGLNPSQHSEFWFAYDNEAIYFAGFNYGKIGSPRFYLGRSIGWLCCIYRFLP